MDEVDASMRYSSRTVVGSKRTLAKHKSHRFSLDNTANERRPKLWALLLPLFVGVVLMSGMEYLSTLEVVRDSYMSVFKEAAANGVLSVQARTDEALVANRAASAHFARRGGIGGVAADRVFVDLLAAFPSVNTIFAGTADGDSSGAGRFDNGTVFVVSVVAPGPLLVYHVDGDGKRTGTPFVNDTTFRTVNRPWYTLGASAAADTTLWTDAYPDAVHTGNAVVTSAMNGTLPSGGAFVAGVDVFIRGLADSLRSGVPMMQENRFSDARLFVVDSQLRQLVSMHGHAKDDTLKTIDAVSDDRTKATYSVLQSAMGDGKLPATFEESSLYGDALVGAAIGTGTDRPAWHTCVSVPNSAYSTPRTGELAGFGVVAGLLLVAVAVSCWTQTTLADKDLGAGLSLLRLLSLAFSFTVMFAAVITWSSTSTAALDLAVSSMVAEVNAHVRSEVETFMGQPSIINELNFKAGRRGEFNFTALGNSAADGHAMDAYLLDMMLVFNKSRAPTTAILLGVDNGDLWGAQHGELLRRDANTNGLIRIVGVGADGKRNESDVRGTPAEYDATQRAWYIKGPPNWSPIYTFAVTGSMGITASWHFQDAVSGREGVWGVDVTLSHLEAQLKQVDLRGADGVLAVVEGPSSRQELIASSGNNTVVLDESTGQLERVLLHQASNSAMRNVGQYVRANSLNTTVQHSFNTGFGLETHKTEMFPLPELGWTVVVALSSESFQNVRRAWSSVALIAAVPIIFITVMLATVVQQAERHAHTRGKLHYAMALFRAVFLWGRPSKRRTSVTAAQSLGTHHDSVHNPTAAARRQAQREMASKKRRAPTSRPGSPQDGPRSSFPGPRSSLRTKDKFQPLSTMSSGSGASVRGVPRSKSSPNIQAERSEYEWDGCMHALGDVLVNNKAFNDCYQRMISFMDDVCLHLAPPQAVREVDSRFTKGDQVFIAAAAALAGVDDTSRVREIGRRLIDRAYQRNNLVWLWFLRVAASDAEGKLRVWAVHTFRSKLYKRLVNIGILFHMGLAFAEGARLERRAESRGTLTVLEFLVLLLYLGDVLMYWIAFCPPFDTMRNCGVHKAMAGSVKKKYRSGMIRAGFLAAFVIDFFVWWISDYTTGPGDIQLFIPVSAMLRPVFLVYRSTSMRLAVSNFVSTVMLSRKVLALGLAFLAVSTVTSIALLEGKMAATTVIGPTFGHIEAFFNDIFVFAATGENYPDLVYSSQEAGGDAFILYFAGLEIAGVFLLVSLLIGFFQQHYNRMYEASEAARSKRDLILRRMSFMVVFRLLQLADTAHATQLSVCGARERRGAHNSLRWEVPSRQKVLLQKVTASRNAMREGARLARDVAAAEAAVAGELETKAVAPSVSDTVHSVKSADELGDSPRGQLLPHGSAPNFREPKQQSKVTLPGLLPDREELDPVAATQSAPTRLTSAASFIRRVSTTALRALDTHAGSDTISGEAFVGFFADNGISVQDLADLYHEEGARLRLFRMDVNVNASRLMSRSHLGCTHEFVGILNRLVNRCVSGMHADARPLNPDNSGVYEFTAVCERRLAPEWAELKQSLAASGLLGGSSRFDEDTLKVSCCRGRVRYTRPRRVVKALQRFFDNETYVRYQVITIPSLVIYVAVMCLTASEKAGDFALVVAPIMMFGFLIEMLVRVYAEGPNDFWSFHRLSHNEGSVQGSFRAESLRFDLCVTALSVVAWIGWKLASIQNGDGFAARSDRLFLALPATRLLSSVDNTRGLVFGLLGSLPSFYSIVTLLMLVVFEYAIVGMWWFGGLLERVPAEVYDIPANFTTLFNAFATLFQLMVGESWNDVLVAAVYARRSLLPMWFFDSYIVIVLLLLTNVLIGIICDKFSDMEEKDRKLQHRIFQEHHEIENTAVRVLQRFFYRKFALKLWRRHNRLASRPSHAALVGTRGSSRSVGGLSTLAPIADDEDMDSDDDDLEARPSVVLPTPSREEVHVVTEDTLFDSSRNL